jgi:hypothetical protein
VPSGLGGTIVKQVAPASIAACIDADIAAKTNADTPTNTGSEGARRFTRRAVPMP